MVHFSILMLSLYIYQHAECFRSYSPLLRSHCTNLNQAAVGKRAAILVWRLRDAFESQHDALWTIWRFKGGSAVCLGFWKALKQKRTSAKNHRCKTMYIKIKSPQSTTE